jgi:RNA polymerase sigma-70 factor, ECF subfamily
LVEAAAGGGRRVLAELSAGIDLVNNRTRRPPVAAGEPADVAPDAGITDVDLGVLRAQLHDALAAIGGVHRDAVIETFLRDRSYAEVAAELGIPTVTVRTRVHYALRRMRRALSDTELCWSTPA